MVKIKNGHWEGKQNWRTTGNVKIKITWRSPLTQIRVVVMKKINNRAGEATQWLRAWAALSEDCIWFPAPTWWVTTMCNSRARDLMPLWPHRHQACTWGRGRDAGNTPPPHTHTLLRLRRDGDPSTLLDEMENNPDTMEISTQGLSFCCCSFHL